MTMTGLAAPTISLAGSGSANGGITNANHLTLTGVAQAGVTISIFDQTTKIGTATADTTGAWSFATATLNEGSHTFTAIAADGSGDLSSSSANVSITVDTIAPTAPTVTSFAPDSNVMGDGVTNANQVILTGTADAGSTIRIYDGTIQVGTATVDASGNWSFATATLADGTHAFTSKAVDAAGNVSAASAALNVTVDTIAPGAPTLVSDTPASGNSLIVSGTAEASAAIKLYEGSTLLGIGVADSHGAWSIKTGSLAAGAYALTASATDAAGNVSGVSNSMNVSLEANAPVAPVINSFSPDSNVAGDGVTNANQVVVTGTGDVGSTIRIYDGTIQLGTATVDASGNWSFATATLADGPHAFTSKAVDAAGNVSAASAALNVTVDTVAPGAPTLVSDTPASGNSLIVSGTAEASAAIKLYEGSTLLGIGVAEFPWRLEHQNRIACGGRARPYCKCDGRGRQCQQPLGRSGSRDRHRDRVRLARPAWSNLAIIFFLIATAAGLTPS